MDRYEILKLVQWAEDSVGRLKSRKRLQKVVFLLKCAKCPFDAAYSLHFYGPYSADVAQLTDELVHVGLLEEEEVSSQVGRQFNYCLSVAADLKAFERTPAGVKALGDMKPFEQLGNDLLCTDLKELEYAATIAYFQRAGHSWDDSFRKTCEFKRLNLESHVANSSLELARRVGE